MACWAVMLWLLAVSNRMPWRCRSKTLAKVFKAMGVWDATALDGDLPLIADIEEPLLSNAGAGDDAAHR